MLSSSMTISIGFPSKVAGVTIVGVYPLGFDGVGTGNGRDPLAEVRTSEALSVGTTEGMFGVGTTGGAPPVVIVGDDGENIVGVDRGCISEYQALFGFLDG